ncbi:MAG: type II secretion system protein [Candidatus Paceibacterota bacterium]|jgi:prepilin-type N-terminal cleavage/methylation domain-containing protein
MQNKKGFTLIELLVVIAIIGILSGMIIVSMSGAQDAAKGARIKAAMDQFRTTAEIYKTTTGGGTSYGSSIGLAASSASPCANVATSMITTGTEGKALCDDIQSQAATALTIYNSATAWCMQKVLPGTPSVTWCVDSAGTVGAHSGCDNTAWTCL